jgi:hypothetical protein
VINVNAKILLTAIAIVAAFGITAVVVGAGTVAVPAAAQNMTAGNMTGGNVTETLPLNDTQPLSPEEMQ